MINSKKRVDKLCQYNKIRINFRKRRKTNGIVVERDCSYCRYHKFEKDGNWPFLSPVSRTEALRSCAGTCF